MKFLILLSFTLTLLYAQTFSVNTLVDITDGSCSDGNCSLRDAIALSSSYDNIDITVKGNIVLSSTLVINHTLSINGSGMNDLNISGNHLYRVFSNQGGDLSISNLGIIDGNSTTGSYVNGAGISSPINNILSLNKVAFINNDTNDTGGAISMKGNLNINSCIFSHNKAKTSSAIYTSGIVSIKSSDFINNISTVSSTIFILGHSSISNSTFKSNSAFNGRAGAIEYNDYATLDNQHSIDNSLFHSNFIQSSSVMPPNGSAIYAESISLHISNSLFYANRSLGGDGTVYIRNTSEYNSSIINSTFYANIAAKGGAIGVDFQNAALQISHCTITQNSSNDSSIPSGGIFHSKGNLYIKNSIIMENYDTDGITKNADCYSEDTANFLSNQHNVYTQTNNCPFVANDFQTSVPQLEIIADNGGFTGTAALKKSSSLIDSGTCSDNYGNIITTDQRGFKRDTQCDIGAYEFGKYGYFPSLYYLLN